MPGAWTPSIDFCIVKARRQQQQCTGSQRSGCNTGLIPLLYGKENANGMPSEYVICFKSFQTACQIICCNHNTCFTSSFSGLRCFLTLVIIHSFCPFSKIFCIRQLGLRTDYFHASLRSESLQSILSLLCKLNQSTHFQSVSNKTYLQNVLKKCFIYIISIYVLKNGAIIAHDNQMY